MKFRDNERLHHNAPETPSEGLSRDVLRMSTNGQTCKVDLCYGSNTLISVRVVSIMVRWLTDGVFIGHIQLEINYDTLHEIGNTRGKNCPENVNMEFNQRISTEILFGNGKKAAL